MRPTIALAFILLSSLAAQTGSRAWTEPEYLADTCNALYEAGAPESSLIPYPNHPGLSYDCGRSYEEQ